MSINAFGKTIYITNEPLGVTGYNIIAVTPAEAIIFLAVGCFVCIAFPYLVWKVLAITWQLAGRCKEP
jgi:hypothetical protein